MSQERLCYDEFALIVQRYRKYVWIILKELHEYSSSLWIYLVTRIMYGGN